MTTMGARSGAAWSERSGPSWARRLGRSGSRRPGVLCFFFPELLTGCLAVALSAAKVSEGFWGVSLGPED